MAKRSYFFMTRDDLLDWLSGFEEELPVTYRLMGPHTGLAVPVFETAASIEQFGVSSGDCVRDSSYLVMPGHVPFVPRVVDAVTGEQRVFVYPEGNPASVILSPGGEYDGRCIIIGELATQSTDPRSVALYKSLVKRLKTLTTLHSTIHVGEEAARRAMSGWRLAERDTAPTHRDLRLE
jgi:hypothetical protein